MDVDSAFLNEIPMRSCGSEAMVNYYSIIGLVLDVELA
jgi:hypothetical protein